MKLPPRRTTSPETEVEQLLARAQDTYDNGDTGAGAALALFAIAHTLRQIATQLEGIEAALYEQEKK